MHIELKFGMLAQESRFACCKTDVTTKGSWTSEKSTEIEMIFLLQYLMKES